MSLFPAYSPAGSSASVVKPDDLSWLTNQSFIPFPVGGAVPEGQEGVSELSDSSDSVDRHIKHKKTKKKKKKHHKRKRSRSASGDEKEKEVPEQVAVSEQEFYTDVQPMRIYLTVDTLHKPACPRYRLGPYRFRLTEQTWWKQNRPVRYFRYFRKSKDFVKTSEKVKEEEMELEKSAKKSNSVESWVAYLRFKADHPVHLDSYQNHKAELDVIERAMRYHPDEEQLLGMYLEWIVKVHPMDHVLELIQKMINKDNANILLWNALINNKQCSMAQCIVPDVLKMYEKSTRALFRARRSDEVMLRLFKKCAIFCRQAGLWEQLFALIELALSINISDNFANGQALFGSPEHFNQLIEYEELILKSGLPMNEIWLRIEKLRSAYHFLPFKGANMCSDPQRMILQEDITGFVYPLINKEYTFDLVILVLKIMKYPFECTAFETTSLFKPEPFEEDYSEQLLPIFLDLNRNRKLDIYIVNLIKELNTSPSFINTNLAFESYLELIREFIVCAARHFSNEKHVILSLLYLKLERILVVFDKTLEPLSDQRKKASRSRTKNLLKNCKYPNDINFYVEYALIEYEMEGLGPSCLKIFNVSVQVFCSSSDLSQDNDLFTLILKFVEILLSNDRKAQAVFILTKLIMNPRELHFNDPEPIKDPTKLIALQKFNERLNQQLEKDNGEEPLLLEHYFTTHPLLNSLRAYLYYLALIKSKTETTKKIESFLFVFDDLTNHKHVFFREQIYDIRLRIQEFRMDDFTNSCLLETIDRVLHEYPSNLTAIRMCAFSNTLTWFQIRTILNKNLTIKSVLLLTASARIRNLLLQVQDQSENDETYKRRILSLLKQAVLPTTDNTPPIRQNAILWRLYLRELFDQPTSVVAATTGGSGNVLEQCRKTLYTALEACPWNKALYLDGAFFAPQELSQLLDLLLEKQLRIHAIPEELEILRGE
ncbi:nuclear exosome regulator NRDE2 [Uranotaenia lowii]|uniref:nuclear exosome regulator NRDE2 n=1 Tax=Uranotaenia lowii TaxID=190385 RepID=UPI002479C8CC|nr:nuclear exosome regulator NRDE2 [Uranotaenia lowii]